jgi:hypothetical protein
MPDHYHDGGSGGTLLLGCSYVREGFDITH